MEKRYRTFAWAGFACDAALVLFQLFGPANIFTSPGTASLVILANIFPLFVFLTVMLGAKRRGVCFTVGILCILQPLIEIGMLYLFYAMSLPMISAALTRTFFEALPAVLIGVALILYAFKHRFPYIGWFATGAGVLYWLYGQIADMISFRISGPSGRIMAWPFPLVDIVYILLAFAVQFLPGFTGAEQESGKAEDSA